MPNGGIDNCGTCSFNTRNKGELGHDHIDGPEPHYCRLRQFVPANPFYTYCANHPYRNLDRLELPIGPIYIGDACGNRTVWQQSPDSEAIRQLLLDLLKAIEERKIVGGPHYRKVSAEETIRDIKCKTRKKYCAEKKIRIVLDGLRGEVSVAELGQRWTPKFCASCLGLATRCSNFSIDENCPTSSVGNIVKYETNGPKGVRTLDLHNAIVALSQLSYGPFADMPIMPNRRWLCKFLSYLPQLSSRHGVQMSAVHGLP
jgi:hypothetical protein